jgi:hypothetical protein
MGKWQTAAANVARDLLAFEVRQAVKTRARNDAGIGDVKVLQVPPIARVTVGAMSSNPRTGG